MAVTASSKVIKGTRNVVTATVTIFRLDEQETGGLRVVLIEKEGKQSSAVLSTGLFGRDNFKELAEGKFEPKEK